jgi:hypothetical protein
VTAAGWSKTRLERQGVGRVAGAHYEIVVRGRLGGSLTRWFDDLEVRSSGPDATYLSGWFADQSALQGVLTRLGDLGLELASVRQLPDAE